MSERQVRETGSVQRGIMEAEAIGAVAALEERLFSDAWSREMISGGMSAPAQTFFTARTPDGRIVGYAAIMTVLDEGELLRIGTDPEFQRQGIGSALMEQVIQAAEERGLSFLLLEVRQGNTPAVRLYEKYGFCREGVRRDYYRNPLEDALIMRRRFLSEITVEKDESGHI